MYSHALFNYLIGSVTQELRAVCVDFITNQQCKDSGYSANSISDAMICAGVIGGGKDACQVITFSP